MYFNFFPLPTRQREYRYSMPWVKGVKSASMEMTYYGSGPQHKRVRKPFMRLCVGKVALLKSSLWRREGIQRSSYPSPSLFSSLRRQEGGTKQLFRCGRKGKKLLQTM